MFSEMGIDDYESWIVKPVEKSFLTYANTKFVLC
jgi:hypothetical protein